ncbi:MAG: hypothetical protein IPO26_18050 [Saprospiraceae bacterium]|nr:hypothetical protein [Saprospiraceae bacterium]
MITKTTTTINSTAEDQWALAYIVINRCNTVIANIDKADPAKKQGLKLSSVSEGALYFG